MTKNKFLRWGLVLFILALIIFILLVVVLPKMEGFSTADPAASVGWDTKYYNGMEGYELLFSDDDSDLRYGRTTLADSAEPARDRWCYDYILGKLADRLDKIDFDNTPYARQIPSDAALHIYNLVIADNPDLFWANGGMTRYTWDDGTIAYIVPYYSVSAEELPAMRANFDTAIDTFLSGIDSSMSEYEREKEIHDRICNACRYDYDAYEAYLDDPETLKNTWSAYAYGCLVDHLAVCDGYSQAFQVLLQRAEIQALKVSGTSTVTGGEHSWSIVRIDGEYYQVDITWDDPDDDGAIVDYTYFNVPDDYMNFSHTLDPSESPFTIPGCTSWTANYITCGGAMTASLELGSLLDSITRQVAAGKGITSTYGFILDREITIEEADAFFSADSWGNFWAICHQIIDCADPSFTYDSAHYKRWVNGNVFSFRLWFS